MLSEDKITKLHSMGIILQRDGEHFIARLAFVGGEVSAGQLQQASQFSSEFGDSKVHLTTRLAMEIHNISSGRIDDFISQVEISDLEFLPNASVVRSVISCPGEGVCPFGCINPQKIAMLIEDNLRNYDSLPAKVEVAVSGCKNSCTQVKFNDIGVVGTPDGKYRLYIGGKGGDDPVPAKELGVVEGDRRLLDIIGKIIDLYNLHGQPDQRIADVIRDVGMAVFFEGLK